MTIARETKSLFMNTAKNKTCRNNSGPSFGFRCQTEFRSAAMKNWRHHLGGNVNFDQGMDITLCKDTSFLLHLEAKMLHQSRWHPGVQPSVASFESKNIRTRENAENGVMAEEVGHSDGTMSLGLRMTLH